MIRKHAGEEPDSSRTRSIQVQESKDRRSSLSDGGTSPILYAALTYQHTYLHSMYVHGHEPRRQEVGPQSPYKAHKANKVNKAHIVWVPGQSKDPAETD